jgi:hypothetical protein
MPNIEIHGLGRNSRAAGLHRQILLLFGGAPYFADVVVIQVNDTACSLEIAEVFAFVKMRPFLRLVSTKEDYIPDVLERLKTLNMDIEYLELAAFYPASDSKDTH